MSLTIEPQFKSYAEKIRFPIPLKSVQAVLEMHKEGATVPFMARYRKEKTGKLDEVEIRQVIATYEGWQELSQRREFILKEIEKQDSLTPELRRQLEESNDLNELEELYRPYKRKKKTKAKIARDAGLEPLANWLWALGHGEIQDNTALEIKAKEYINPTAGFATYEEALRGAQHIIVEKLANTPELRKAVKDELFERAKIKSEKTTKYKTHSKYQMYAEFEEPLKNLLNTKASHRYLALRRGWQEGELKVTVEGDEALLLGLFEAAACSQPTAAPASFLKASAKQALTVHVLPSVTNELHNLLKDKADEDAIAVFAENVRRVLLGSPFGSKVVLGVDPGLKTGCKLALLDKSGQFISHTVMHILTDADRENAKKLFAEVLKQITIEAVAVGNGTGGREAEAFLRKILGELGAAVPVIMVNESGASVYSASEVAREEFPELDLTVRGAISIARRLRDPLSELVKIEPKSIGVGQYQHDVSQNKLKKSLHDVVESCVNQVGVDLNTASESLLQYVSGIGPGIAKNIVQQRKAKGLFEERESLLKVPHFSSKVFEQAAGFLRVPDGKVALDRTGIHPERYSAVREMAQEVGKTVSQLIGSGASQLLELREKWSKLIGEYTFEDIVRELEKPGRDPRDPFKVFKFREDIHEIKDLKDGMICPGIVTNVTNFGAFVDIGVHQDGLVHISELSYQFVNDPRQVVSPGDQVQVKVLAVDKDKSQISLSMKTDEKRAQRAAGARAESPREAGAGRQRQRPKGPRRAAQGAKPQGAGPGQERAARSRNGERRGDKKGKPQRGPSPGNRPRPTAQPFNNPFAGLTAIKK